MSKVKLISTISEELQYINQEIDWRIIKGMPYRKEARRHKLLVSMLHDVEGKHEETRSSGFLSFLF